MTTFTREPSAEAPVGHRAELVDTPAERRQDPLDRVAQLAARRRRRPRSARSSPRAPRIPRSERSPARPRRSGSARSSSSGPRPTVSRSTSSTQLGTARGAPARPPRPSTSCATSASSAARRPPRRGVGSPALPKRRRSSCASALDVLGSALMPGRGRRRQRLAPPDTLGPWPRSRCATRTSPGSRSTRSPTPPTPTYAMAAASRERSRGPAARRSRPRATSWRRSTWARRSRPRPGDMPARWVIHAATMELGGPTSAAAHPRRHRVAPSRVAAELGARSLALVAFGTGVGGFPLDEAARIEVEEVAPPPRRPRPARADRVRRLRRAGAGGVRAGSERELARVGPGCFGRYRGRA